jgi:hypothetical protein
LLLKAMLQLLLLLPLLSLLLPQARSAVPGVPCPAAVA